MKLIILFIDFYIGYERLERKEREQKKKNLKIAA